jgi:flagellar biosynthetic protein FlhB
MSDNTSSSEHDRTEPASQFKLSEARKQGQVAKSMDVNSLVMVFSFLCALMMLGAKAWQQMGSFSENLFSASSVYAYDQYSLIGALVQTASAFWAVILTPLCFGVGAAILGNLIQTGPIFSGAPLTPKFERLNPIAGFKRVFNKRMLFETLKGLIKLVILVSVAYITFSAHWQELSVIGPMSAREQLNWFAGLAVALLFRLVMAMVVIALLDLVLTRTQFAKQMRMSRRDMKEEVKRREGDPLIRSKIRQLQKENLKQSKSLGRVADADVLITNPTHLAVALRTLGEVTGAGAWGDGHEVKAVDYFMRSIAICKEIGNELEVAKSYRAFSGYVAASAHYQSIPEIQREAQKLSEMADEIFERHRIRVTGSSSLNTSPQ